MVEQEYKKGDHTISLLQTINKTEDGVKFGLSISDMHAFFEQHNLRVRVFDDNVYHLIYNHEPEVGNHNSTVQYYTA